MKDIVQAALAILIVFAVALALGAGVTRPAHAYKPGVKKEHCTKKNCTTTPAPPCKKTSPPGQGQGMPCPGPKTVCTYVTIPCPD